MPRVTWLIIVSADFESRSEWEPKAWVLAVLCSHYQRRYFGGFVQLPCSGRKFGVLRGYFVTILSARGPALGWRLGFSEGYRDALLTFPFKEALAMPAALSVMSSSGAVAAAEGHPTWQPMACTQ